MIIVLAHKYGIVYYKDNITPMIVFCKIAGIAFWTKNIDFYYIF